MRFLAAMLTVVPVALFAQAPAQTPKPAAGGSAPATTAGAKPAAATQAAKPAASTPAKPAASAAKPATSAPAKPAASTATKAAPSGGRGSTATPAAPAPAPPPAPMTDAESTVYALGVLMNQSLAAFDLSPAELDILKRGLTDASQGKSSLELDQWGPKIEPLAMARRGRIMAREKAAGLTFLASAAAEAGAVRTPSGLVYREMAPGVGASPRAADTVRVHYRGTLINGTEFDSSYARNEPADLSLGGVIPCWTEGLQKMRIGGKARLVCPSNLAYGDEGSAPIPGGATLIFDIELLGIVSGR